MPHTMPHCRRPPPRHRNPCPPCRSSVPIPARNRTAACSSHDLKFLQRLTQTGRGTSNQKRHGYHILPSAPLLPKFVWERAAMYHELRKRGTSAKIKSLSSGQAGEKGCAMNDTVQDTETDFVYAAAETVRSFTRALLAAHRVPDDDARIVAECLVKADLRGVDTHGAVRLPIYLSRLRRGLINPRLRLEPKRITPVAAQNGFGFVAGMRAMREAIGMAQGFGIGLVAVKHSTHFGMAAGYVLEALAAGLIGMVFSNASRAMPPWGGREALLGTSPLAVGAPAGDRSAFLLDMSPAVAARGKIRRALKRGESIPPGYALDAEGRPTTDPERALQGVVLPIGGPKGSGLSMLMDIFGGVLSGAASGGDVGDQYKHARPQDVGHFFLALKPDLFVPLAQYRERMDTLIARVRACPPAAGFTEVLIAGEPELRHEAERRRRGIPYNRNEIADLEREAVRAGIAPPVVGDRALAP